VKEIREIVQSYGKWVISGKRCALATVVSVEGSAYRRPGARMLISEDGMLTGAISGGCLEGDAMKKALLVINSQQPALVTYDTMDEDDAIIGVGLGCNGIIKILIEPIIESSTPNPLQILQHITTARRKNIIATFYTKNEKSQNTSGTKLYIDESGSLPGNVVTQDCENTIYKHYKKVFENRQSVWVDFEENNIKKCVFLEFVPPVIQLVIAGAGNDVKPVTEMASILGWDAVVIDGRVNYAKKERFPSACNVMVAKPEQVLKNLLIDEFTYFILMTHNYIYDKALLKELCQSNVKYIGMLGPRKKLDRMLQEFENEGNPITDDQVHSIYSPVGMDIGAETSEEIALSIISEIKAIHENKKSVHLRTKSTPIHA
jgi:xanthine dehydrogenase accessory factor